MRPPADLGEDYTPVDEEASQADREPFSVDPAVVERGVQSHRKLQNALAAHVADRGCSVKKPRHEDPPWDLYWLDGDGNPWVAEVKSLTPKNEERQLGTASASS